MENWRVEVTAGGKSLTVVKTQRGVFQGYTQSQLVAVIAMMHRRIKLCKYQEKNQPPNAHLLNYLLKTT